MERKLCQLRQNIIGMLVCFIMIVAFMLLNDWLNGWQVWIRGICSTCAVLGVGLGLACLRIGVALREDFRGQSKM